MIIVKLLGLNGLVVAGWFWLLPESPYWFGAIVVLSLGLAAIWLWRDHQQRTTWIKKLEHGLQNILDNDFSTSLSDSTIPAYQNLINLFNRASDSLREERQRHYQREMLFDQVLQSSPVATILVNHRDHIVLANLAAHRIFEKGDLVGSEWTAVVNQLDEELRQGIATQGDTIVTLLDRNKNHQAWHMSSSVIMIQKLEHRLFILTSITKELSRQELQTWKNVVRLISHELSNTLAPISTMCHSGKVIIAESGDENLNRVFNSIAGRVEHLDEFVKSYGELARLKLPQKSLVDWRSLVEHVGTLYAFDLITSLPTEQLYADQAQLEQVLINLLKNAHEADAGKNITLSLASDNQGNINITVADGGPGMSESTMKSALLPFYSTKREGMGLGLALCREIVDAHNGNLTFSNREQGGLKVNVSLPLH